MQTPTRIALAVWNGRISPVFDVARRVLIVDIAAGEVTGSQEADMPDEDFAGKAVTLAGLGVETLICGAISRACSGVLEAHGIRPIGFVAGEIESVLAAYLQGRLDRRAYRMPGCECRCPRGRNRRATKERM